MNAAVRVWNEESERAGSRSRSQQRVRRSRHRRIIQDARTIGRETRRAIGRTSVGDFSELDGVADLASAYGLIFVVLNTLFALTTRESQIRCFAGVAARVRPGGRFIVEAFVPDPKRLAAGQHIEVRSVEVDSLRVNVARYDTAAQTVAMMHRQVGARRQGRRGFDGSQLRKPGDRHRVGLNQTQ